MDKKLFTHRGLAIILTISIVTLWMYFTNKLVLFIHPRYFLFTAIFAAIGLILSIIALTVATNTENMDPHKKAPTKPKKTLFIGSTFLFILLLSLFTPTSLSTQTVNLSRVNNFTFNINETITEDESKFTIKNWSTVLTGNLPFDDTQKVTLTGFIVPIDEDSFYLTRYVLSCCAIDAQPVAVPVNQPNWQKTYEEGNWVEVKGQFKETTFTEYTHILHPSDLTKVQEPDEPYDY